MFNAGLARQAAKEPARAADAFQKAFTLGGLTEEQIGDATQRSNQLR